MQRACDPMAEQLEHFVSQSNQHTMQRACVLLRNVRRQGADKKFMLLKAASFAFTVSISMLENTAAVVTA